VQQTRWKTASNEDTGEKRVHEWKGQTAVNELIRGKSGELIAAQNRENARQRPFRVELFESALFSELRRIFSMRLNLITTIL
jgi:hypothetical protein